MININLFICMTKYISNLIQIIRLNNLPRLIIQTNLLRLLILHTLTNFNHRIIRHLRLLLLNHPLHIIRTLILIRKLSKQSPLYQKAFLRILQQ